MKKFTLLTLLWVLSFTAYQAVAQTPVRKRCTTMEILEQQLQDPAFRAEFEANQARILQSRANARTTNSAVFDTIPVVVHIITSNPNLVTDAVCQSQMDVLTEDFKGLNADSTRIPAAFKPLFGKGGLTFMLARTAPNGTITSGIERRTNAITFTSGTLNNAKKFATGGLDAWDNSKYFNMWVVEFTDGTLGSSVFPGTPGDPTFHGFCADYRAWGRNAPYLDPAFNKGRTATHEIGHFWNLRHIWGDDGGACTGSDFPGSPAGWDDTPNQASQTFGNPDVPGTGTVKTDACSAAAPGIMYQNYMDYCDDIALVMFTQGQWQRMDQALLTAPDRTPLLSSTTYKTPVTGPYDAAITGILNPLSNQTLCGVSSVTPQVTITNLGSNALTSLTITVSVNGGTPTNIPWTGSLASGSSANVTLAAVPLTAGNYTLNICATNINNGQTDSDNTNNCQSVTFSLGSGLTLPVTQDFSSATFPPAGWTLARAGGTTTTAAWKRDVATASGAPGSAMANFWSIGTGNKIDLISPLVSTAGADSIIVNFDVAARQYNAVQDTLQLLVSGDCGNTYTLLWQEWSSLLAATPASAAQYTAPAASDWRNKRVALPAAGALTILNNPAITFAWRAVSRFGNNIFLDNINITKKNVPSVDAQLKSINSPNTTSLCDVTTITPNVTVSNQGRVVITSVKVSYTFDNAAPVVTTFSALNLGLGRDTVFTLPAISNIASGNHTLKVYTSEPNGLADPNVSNDTVTKAIAVFTSLPAPLVEGFESATFPPAGWQISQQPADAVTWKQFKTRRSSRDSMSAYMNNYNYPNLGRIDNLISPPVKYSSVDSVYLSFDVAAATYSFPGSTAIPLDTLEVLVSKDCGITYTSVYKKFGNELQTVGDPNQAFDTEFFPTSPRQWRKDSINLTSLLGSTNSVRFAFRSIENFENNIFIDNISFTTKVVPDKVKSNGFMIAPSPFSSNFTIQHYLPPTDLRGYGVYNSVGQQVINRSFGAGTADSYINVNMAHLPAGVYTVKLFYSGKTVSQKVVKVN